MNVRSQTKPIDKAEMKRIFAARRRRAQIEMATNNKDVVVNDASNAVVGVVAVDKAKDENVGGNVAATANVNVNSTSNNDASSQIKTEKAVKKSTSNSRRALEMYGRYKLDKRVVNSHHEKNGCEEKIRVDNGGKKEKDKEDITIKEGINNEEKSNSNQGKEKTVRFANNPQCSPPRPRTVTTLHEVDEEEDDDFLLFVAGLKREVVGDHTEVSFTCCCCCCWDTGTLLVLTNSLSFSLSFNSLSLKNASLAMDQFPISHGPTDTPTHSALPQSA